MPELLSKKSIQLTLLGVGIIIQTTGVQSSASALTLTPTPHEILRDWTEGPELRNGVWGGGSRSEGRRAEPQTGLWGVDDTGDKWDGRDFITSQPSRIGDGYDYSVNGRRDTDRYASLISSEQVSGDSSFVTDFFTEGDNDPFGLVFGYQDPDNYYSFSWGIGLVKRIMQDQIDGTNGPREENGPYERPDLGRYDERGPNVIGTGGIVVSKTVDGVTTFFESSYDYYLRWDHGVSYNLGFSRIGDQLSVRIMNGQETIYDTQITDTTFMSGRVGFNVGGVETFFSDVEIKTLGTVPEPLTVLGSLSAIGFGTFFKRKITQKSK